MAVRETVSFPCGYRMIMILGNEVEIGTIIIKIIVIEILVIVIELYRVVCQ